MPPPVGFLSLPRELRDTIYHHYVFEIDGYRFDYESGKMRTVDLYLSYTCSLVARETHHLALRSNVIHFFPSETRQKEAALFHLFHWCVQEWRETALGALAVPAFQRYRTPELDAEAALRYPQFESLLSAPVNPKDDIWPAFAYCWSGGYGSSWGEANSMFRAFQEYMLKLLTKDTDFPEALASFCAQTHERPDDDEPSVEKNEWLLAGRGPGSEWASSLQRVLSQSCPEVWSIPSKDEIEYIKTCLGSYTYKYSFWERMKWRL